MDRLIEILEDCCPGVDFRAEKRLVDDEIIDSFDIVMIVGELTEQYGVKISVDDLLPENFNSVEGIYAVLNRYLAEE